jgi:hypothetical protein
MESANGGGNTGVFITTNGVVVVDTKNPGWGRLILSKIQELTSKPVTTIINTHGHWDHVSGNVDFPATVEIVAQENARVNMTKMAQISGLATPCGDPARGRENGVGYRVVRRQGTAVHLRGGLQQFACRGRQAQDAGSRRLVRNQEPQARSAGALAEPPPEESSRLKRGVPMHKHRLDEVDRRILHAYTANARMTYADLGARVGLSNPNVCDAFFMTLRRLLRNR